VPRGAKSRMRRTKTPKSIWIKFCVVIDITNVVTYANFCDHRLRGFWVAGGQSSSFPIDFDRHPYNTLALPCECVIDEMSFNLLTFCLCFKPRVFSYYEQFEPLLITGVNR